MFHKAPFAPPDFTARRRGRGRLEILRNSAKGLGENLALTIFDVSVSDAVEERVLCRQSIEREGISSGDISRGGIAEITRDRQ
jgi:hypothetical protein